MKKRSYASPYLQEAKKKQRRAKIKKIIIFVLAFAVIFTGLVFLSRWQKLNIENVEVTGNSAADSFLVAKAVKDEIRGYYLWVFPKTNFLIYPKGAIKKTLTDQFKIFQNVSISLNGIQKLEVKVTEREGKYTWCGADLPVDTSTPYKCYFMDANGYIFDDAPYFSGDVYLKFFGKGGLGTNFYPNLFSKLLTLRNNIEALGLKAPSLLVKDDGDIELYLSSSVSFDAALASAPKIILKSDSDFEKVVENLQSALGTEPLQSQFKKSYAKLQYIDLRFGNKVYYKFQ